MILGRIRVISDQSAYVIRTVVPVGPLLKSIINLEIFATIII